MLRFQVNLPKKDSPKNDKELFFKFLVKITAVAIIAVSVVGIVVLILIYLEGKY